ncbi:MAG: hypothetical protein AAFX04_12275 [Pseudomonadota bacterium]
MQSQFDYSAVWNRTLALVGSNVQILIGVIGVFFVVPQFAATLIAVPPQPDPNATLEEVLATMSAFYNDNLLLFLLTGVIGAIGSITVLSIYLDDDRPTVGTAIAAAFGLLISYFVANILVAFAVSVGFFLLIIPGIYVAIKFICVGPVIVAEKIRNPITAMQRSWTLTKGNSLRIFGFVLILILVLAVIASVIGLVTTIFKVAGEDSVMFTIGQLLQIMFQGVATAFSLAVSAAIYLQLCGPDNTRLHETFK